MELASVSITVENTGRIMGVHIITHVYSDMTSKTNGYGALIETVLCTDLTISNACGLSDTRQLARLRLSPPLTWQDISSKKSLEKKLNAIINGSIPVQVKCTNKGPSTLLCLVDLASELGGWTNINETSTLTTLSS